MSGAAATAADTAAIRRALDDAFAEIAVVVDSIDDVLLPVPLLTPAEESRLRSHGGAVQLARARDLGVRVADSAAIRQLEQEDRLVPLEDSTEYWIVRELDYSMPWVTPGTRALLDEIATRFKGRLLDMGLPPYRLEVTSALRTAELQEALRRVNPNAARGESAHEYGVAIDIAYSGYAAPRDPVVDLDDGGVPWLEPRLQRIEDALLETVAAKKSRELKAILGKVLLELQAEGAVMVTLERLQPVYHLTLARRG
ncbi:MAG: DUF5715 family protein [Longimicrobiales bacterium]